MANIKGRPLPVNQFSIGIGGIRAWPAAGPSTGAGWSFCCSGGPQRRRELLDEDPELRDDELEPDERELFAELERLEDDGRLVLEDLDGLGRELEELGGV